MVTAHRAFGFRFVVFPNDHAPPHVHVFGHGGEAKIGLSSDGVAQLVWSHRVSRADLRRVVAEATAHHAALLEAWRMVHGG
jgi:hypothetical protein